MRSTSAKVTESKFLTDRLTGEKCEVDVCIEDESTGHSIILCVEVRDRSRPASVEWVREMRGKHEHLPTNKLVLASRSGFSKTARKDAELAGVDLLVYKNITEQDVQNTIGPPTLSAMTYGLTATKVVGIVPATETLAAERVALNPDNDCFDEQGTLVGNALQLVISLLKDRRLAEKFMREGTESHKFFAVEIDVPSLATGGRACIQKIEPPTLRTLDKLEIHGTCRVSPRAQFQMQHGALGDVPVTWGTGMLDGKDAMVIAVKQEGAEPTLTLHLDEPRIRPEQPE
ncbi:MAG TPA: restriction endonuclease [Vicinamibacterales bacterium]|nr:restriction endonuclease [Vicinamibacterales bacterium]